MSLRKANHDACSGYASLSVVSAQRRNMFPVFACLDVLLLLTIPEKQGKVKRRTVLLEQENLELHAMEVFVHH